MKLIKSAAFLFFIIFSSAAWCADTPVDNSTVNADTTPAISRSEPDPESQLIAALAKEQTPDTEVIWLETAKETRLALYQPTGSAVSHGGILIFHDQETSPDWPEIVRPLRTQLTRHGWNTLSVSVPYPAQLMLPERTLSTPGTEPLSAPSGNEASSDDNASPATSVESTEQQVQKESYQETFTRIAQAASEQLSAKNHHRQVVIGIGNGALWGAAYVQQNQQAQDLRLIMINPSQPADPQSPKLLDLIPELSVTTLDLYFASSPQKIQDAARRKRTALRHKLPNYKQFRVNQQTDDHKREQQWLTRQVRGLLHTHIVKADEKTPIATPAMQPEPSQLTPGS
ncbi:MAG: DUF3530 family protein [Amphritea sp.]